MWTSENAYFRSLGKLAIESLVRVTTLRCGMSCSGQLQDCLRPDGYLGGYPTLSIH
jgi:hypothetical protein